MSNYACIPFIITREFDDQGNLLAFGRIETYQAGTTIPLETYADAGGFASNLNPVVLDASGSASIFLKGQAYKFVFRDADGNLIRTVDNVLGTASASGGSMVVVSNYAALRALTTDFDVVMVLGRNTPDDGGYGVFEQVPFAADDDGITLNRALVTSYRRQFVGDIDPQWFGVVYMQNAAQNSAILSALAASSSKHPAKFTGYVCVSSIAWTGYSIFSNACQFVPSAGTVTINFSSAVVDIQNVFFHSQVIISNPTFSTARSSWFSSPTSWIGMNVERLILDSIVSFSDASVSIAATGIQTLLVDTLSSTPIIDLDHPAPSLTIGRFAETPLYGFITGNAPVSLSFPCPAKPEWFVIGTPSDWSEQLKSAMLSGRVELSQSYNISTATTFPSAVVSSAIPSGITGQSTFSGPALRFLANCTIPQLTANGIELYADATARLTATSICATDCYFNSALVPLAFATTTAYLQGCLLLAGISGTVHKSACRTFNLDSWQTTQGDIDAIRVIWDRSFTTMIAGGATIDDTTPSLVMADNSSGDITLTMSNPTLLGVGVRRVVAYSKTNTVTINGTFWNGTATVTSVTLGGASPVFTDFIPGPTGWYLLRSVYNV